MEENNCTATGRETGERRDQESGESPPNSDDRFNSQSMRPRRTSAEASHGEHARNLRAAKKDSATLIHGDSPRCTKFNSKETFTL